MIKFKLYDKLIIYIFLLLYIKLVFVIVKNG